MRPSNGGFGVQSTAGPGPAEASPGPRSVFYGVNGRTRGSAFTLRLPRFALRLALSFFARLTFFFAFCAFLAFFAFGAAAEIT
jgi:hypothetical protein